MIWDHMISILGNKAEKKQQQKNMAEIKHWYITKPSAAAGLKCSLCNTVAKEPWQHGKCGKLFCKECLNRYGRYRPCNSCKLEHPQYFEDNKSKGEIRALRVNCTHSTNNCPWTGTVATLDSHLAFKDKKCASCEWKGHPQKLQNHLEKECPFRMYECQYCKEKGPYKTITGPHDRVCKKKPVRCPHYPECDGRVQRQGIKRHLECCPVEEVPCKFAKLGCNIRVKRKDLAKHEIKYIRDHHDLAMEATVHLCDTVKKLPPVTFSLMQYKKKKDCNRIIVSPPFYTSPRGYHMAVEIHLGNGEQERKEMSVYVKMLAGLYDSKLKWPFTGKVAIAILNQIADENHLETTLNIEAGSDLTPGRKAGPYSTVFHLMDLTHNSSRNTQYLKDNTIYFKVSVDATCHKPWLECTETK